jgi:PKD repeat protein
LFPDELTISDIANQQYAPDDTVNFTATASGGDPDAAFVYYISGQPEGISIDPATGDISGIVAANAAVGGPNDNGIHQVTVSVKKEGSVPYSTNFVWSVTPTWISKDENENYTARHENSFVQAGDKFYLMGGREDPTIVDVYDYGTDTWENLSNSMPDNLEFNHFQATEYQGLIWVIGAFNNNLYPNEVPEDHIWAFDPATRQWIQGPEIPEGRRRGSTGLVVYNDKFYVVGGNTMGHSGGYVAWFDEYDPQTGAWTPLDDAPHARDHFAAVLIGNKLYAAGGRLSGGAGGTFAPTIPEVDVYDFTNNSWSTLPAGQNIPTQRAGASAVNFNEKLVVIGGEPEAAGDALTVTEEYDPSLQTWRTLPALNFPRHGTQAIVSGNGIFILGGSDVRGGGGPQKNMEFLGEDAPVGAPSVSSVLGAPASVQIADGDNSDIILSLADGNVGIIVDSFEITGPDAADFNIVSGDLVSALIPVNGSHTLNVELTGTGAGRNAVLTVHYNGDQSLEILLSNDNIAPVVENPGNQYNYEGDLISLPIVANDGGGTLSYSATGLPPTLTIDPVTGIIGGTVSEGGTGDGASQEEGGLVIIEAEAANWAGWDITNAEGVDGILANTDSFGSISGTTIPYEVTISNPGVYRFVWRGSKGEGASDAANDAWLRFPNNADVWFFGQDPGSVGTEAAMISNLNGAQNNVVFPKGSSREGEGETPHTGQVSVNGFLKVYRGSSVTGTNYKWYASANDTGQSIYVYFVNAGTYTMEVSERSAGHAIDKMALYKVDGTAYTDTELTNAPVSETTGTIEGAADNSPYNVQVTVEDDADPAASTTVDFQWFIGAQGDPLAVISAEPVSGVAPLVVQFNGSGSMPAVDIVTYLWDFKDENTSNEMNPEHTFNTPGTYEVSLTVTDNNDVTATSTITITVFNAAPVAVATANVTEGEAPLIVNFTGSGSTDDTGIDSYLWDFGGLGTSALADPSFEFLAAGEYTVSLTVTDAGGLSDEATLTITVTEPGANQAPVAVAIADVMTGEAPLIVNFTGSGSTDDTGIETYLWDFGGLGTSALADPSFEFLTAGEYTVSLTVTDAGGLSAETTLTITVTEPGANQAPVAVAIADVMTGEAPLIVNFTGSGSTDDAGIETYLWDFGGLGTSALADPSFEFLAAGEYTVTLTVTDEEGLTGTDTVTITVTEPGANQAPVAVASSDVDGGEAPLTVNFTGSTSTDDAGIETYLWDFGGLGTSALADPSFEFLAAGEYTVSLTVTDAGGLSDETTLTITVTEPGANQAPVAVASSDVDGGEAPLTVNFIGSASTDDVGIETYAWDFEGLGTSTLADPSFEFLAAGEYTVTLTVTDEEGLTGTDTVTITVTDPGTGNAAPEAVAIADVYNGLAPLTVNFTGSTSMDDVAVTGYEWNFGDGETSNEDDPTHIYTEIGTYDVMLTVTDAEGLQDTANLTITVVDPNNPAPIANISANPINGMAPLPVIFSAQGSTDEDGIVSYLWDFADGTTSNVRTSDAPFSHTFTEAGIYEVMLTVTDGAGRTGTATVTITVSDTNAAPVAVATADVMEGEAPLEVNFNGSASTDDVGIESYLWDFGDGETSNEMNPTHTFTFAGEFEVSLTVTDAEGFSRTVFLTIVVTDNGELDVEGMRAYVAPNPTRDVANVYVEDVPVDDFVKIIYLHDFAGKYLGAHMAQELYRDGRYQVPIPFLQDGIYSISLIMNSDRVETIKLVVRN